MPKKVLHQDRHVRHLINDDGSIVVRVSNLPISKKDKGKWIDQDGKFTAKQGGFVAGVGETLVFLPNKLNRPIEFTGTSSFSIRPMDASMSSAVLATTEDRVTYGNVWPGVDLEYSIVNGGLKEDIVIKTAEARTTFVFETSEVLDTEYAPVLHTNYKTGKPMPHPTGVATTYLAKATAGEFSIPSPIAFDGKNETVGTTWYVSGKMIHITYYPQPGHVYPITVDPVVNVPSTLVTNGSTTTVVVPVDATAINYARVRFIGNTVSNSNSTSNSNSESGRSDETVPPAGCDMPVVSGGTSCSHSHSAFASNNSIYFVHGHGPAGSGDRDDAGSLSFSGAYSTGWCQTTYSWTADLPSDTSGSSVSATANYTTTTHASNPNVRANGGNWVNPTSTTANNPGPANSSSIGTLSSGTSTSWFDLPNFGLKTNTLEHSTGSVGHYYEVEYSYSVGRYQMMV